MCTLPKGDSHNRDVENKIKFVIPISGSNSLLVSDSFYFYLRNFVEFDGKDMQGIIG